MTAIVGTFDLKAALNDIIKVAKGDDHVGVYYGKRILTFHAANSSTYVWVHAPVMSSSREEGFLRTVEARKLHGHIKSHLCEEVKIDVAEGGLRVRGVSGTVILKTFEDFPQIPEWTCNNKILQINGKQLAGIYKRCSPFVNKDASEYSNNGILLEQSGLAVGTDVCQLAVSNAVRMRENNDWTAVIQKDTFKVASQIFRKSEKIVIRQNDEVVSFWDPATGNIVRGHLLTGEFPKWEIIKPEATDAIEIGRKEFRAAVEQAVTCTKEDELPIMKLLVGCGERVEVATQNGLFAPMPFLGPEIDEALMYRFNPVQILTWLKTLDKNTGNVRFWLTDPSQVAHFQDADFNDYIVMPIR